MVTDSQQEQRVVLFIRLLLLFNVQIPVITYVIAVVNSHSLTSLSFYLEINKTSIYLSLSVLSIFTTVYPTRCHRDPGDHPREPGAQGWGHTGQGANPSQGTITDTFTHHGQLRDANQPTMHASGLVKETGIPGGNPGSTGGTCKCCTHTAEAGIESPDSESNPLLMLLRNHKS